MKTELLDPDNDFCDCRTVKYKTLSQSRKQMLKVQAMAHDLKYRGTQSYSGFRLPTSELKKLFSHFKFSFLHCGYVHHKDSTEINLIRDHCLHPIVITLQFYSKLPPFDFCIHYTLYP